MPAPCKSPGCKLEVPAPLADAGFCVAHFTADIERACADFRRETAAKSPPAERLTEIERYIAERGELLARTATSKLRLPVEMKSRILNTFLTLMNLRENLERSLGRAGGAR